MDTQDLTTAISAADANTWLRGYEQAWESRDPEKVVALFTPNASYRDNRFGRPMTGLDAIRHYWATTVNEFQRDVNFDFQLWGIAGNQCIATWQCTFLWLPINGVIEIDGIFRITFAGMRNGVPLCQTFEEWYESREA